MSLRYFLRETNADTLCDSSAVPRDLVLWVVGDNSAQSASTSSETFEEIESFDVVATAHNPIAGAFAVSVNLNLFPANGEMCLRLRAVNTACGALASSAYGATIIAAGVTAQTLTLSTWPSGAVRLRLSVEGRSTDAALATFGIRAGSTSYVDAPFGPRLRLLADEVLKRIQAITIATGYHFDIGDTARGRAWASEATAFPAVYVWSVGFADRHAELLTDGPLSREATAVIVLRLALNQTDPQVDHELVASDIVLAVEGDPKQLGRADYVVSVTAVSLDAVETDAQVQSLTGLADLTLEIVYRMARAAL